MSNNPQTEKQPNPQGKGLVGVLEQIQQHRPLQIAAKSSEQWLADYFTSLLVLSAHFKFRPVVGQGYHLYLKDDQWRLSLVAPHTWGRHDPGAYLGRCELHSDRTWSLEPAEGWRDNDQLVNKLQAFSRGFTDSFDQQKPIVEQLPFYVQQLPYYQRLGANALASSLQSSLAMEHGASAQKRMLISDLTENLEGDAWPLLLPGG